MRSRESIYRFVEAVIGRDLAWKMGRFLYLGARRELGNDAASNGEYALIDWVLTGFATQMPGGSRNAPAKAVVIDVGANLGDWTDRVLAELASRNLGDAVCIHAYEPAPPQNAHLRARLAAAILDGHVQVHPEAVSAARAVAKFSVTGPLTGTNALASGAPTGGDQTDVEVITLDEAAPRLGLCTILLVKVDTEGNDLNVITGAAKLLAEGCVTVLQFEYNWRWVGFGHCLHDVFAAIENCSYVLGRLTRDHIEIHERWHPELEHYFETNYVLVHRDALSFLPHRRVAFSPSNTLHLV